MIFDINFIISLQPYDKLVSQVSVRTTEPPHVRNKERLNNIIPRFNYIINHTFTSGITYMKLHLYFRYQGMENVYLFHVLHARWWITCMKFHLISFFWPVKAYLHHILHERCWSICIFFYWQEDIIGKYSKLVYYLHWRCYSMEPLYLFMSIDRTWGSIFVCDLLFSRVTVLIWNLNYYAKYPLKKSFLSNFKPFTV